MPAEAAVMSICTFRKVHYFLHLFIHSDDCSSSDEEGQRLGGVKASHGGISDRDNSVHFKHLRSRKEKYFHLKWINSEKKIEITNLQGDKNQVAKPTWH